MTDSLRDRITAALRNMTGDLTYEAMADAVIRELGMRQQFLGESIGRPQSDTYRYVTEWTADE